MAIINDLLHCMSNVYLCIKHGVIIHSRMQMSDEFTLHILPLLGSW